MSKYGVIPGPYFPAFGLNTEIYSVNPRISVFIPKTAKYKSEVTPYSDTFYALI